MCKTPWLSSFFHGCCVIVVNNIHWQSKGNWVTEGVTTLSYARMVTPMPLTDSAIKALKPVEKRFKVFDGGGLYLEVLPTGSKVCA